MDGREWRAHGQRQAKDNAGPVRTADAGRLLRQEPVWLRLAESVAITAVPSALMRAFDERYGVIFSKYDLSCALERQNSLECAGYSRDDAAKIGINIILWFLATYPKSAEIEVKFDAKRKAAMSEVGLSVDAVQKGMSTDATATLMKVVDSIRKLPEVQFTARERQLRSTRDFQRNAGIRGRILRRRLQAGRSGARRNDLHLHGFRGDLDPARKQPAVVVRGFIR